jgi:hypothetical protein
VGFPHDSILVHGAPHIDKRYIRQLFRRAETTLADIIEDESPDMSRLSSTLVWIAPDGHLLTAHNSTAQISLFIRDVYSGRMRVLPLLPAKRREGLHLLAHDIFDPENEITNTDEIFICIESGVAHKAMNSEQRALMLGRFLSGPRGSEEKAAEFLTRLAQRAGAKGSFSITFAKLQPARSDPLLIALFEGDSAAGRRLGAGMVPVIGGILERDMALRHYTHPVPRPVLF